MPAPHRPLGDLLTLEYGKALPAHDRKTGTIPVYGSNGIVGQHSLALVDGPGVIIGRKGSLGKVAFSDGPFWPIDTAYYVRLAEDLDWQFLFYALRHAKLDGLNTHSAVPGLNREDAYRVAIFFPEPNCQQAIGAALRAAADAQACGAALAEKAIDIKVATMRHVFSHGLHGEARKETDIGAIPESWDLSTIGGHFDVVSGGTPSRANPAFWSGGTIPWVKTAEVNYRVISDTEEYITELGLSESAAKLLPAGTILMAMYGQGVTRGKVAILGVEAACNQACAALRPRGTSINLRYLYHFLTFRYEEIRRLSHGGQQQNLNLDIVRDLAIIVPEDISEQVEIADILDAIDVSVNLHGQKRAVLDELFQSLLNGLMSGAVDVNELDLSVLEATA